MRSSSMKSRGSQQDSAKNSASASPNRRQTHNAQLSSPQRTQNEAIANQYPVSAAKASNQLLAPTQTSPNKNSPQPRSSSFGKQQNPQHLTVSQLDKSADHSYTMPPQKNANPFEIVPASSTSQISPSPARTSVKSGTSHNRLSMSAGPRSNRNVSFAGSAKAGANVQANIEQASNVATIIAERSAWQITQVQRWLELPQVNGKQHTSLSSIYPVVRDQTIFLADQIKELDQIFESKHGMVSKYKTLNQTHKQTVQENAELAAENARLKAAAGGQVKEDPQVGQLRLQITQLQKQNEALSRANLTENQKMAKTTQAESEGKLKQLQQLQQRLAFLEKQNENYLNENQALRQAQIEMEQRHTEEIIEVKQVQLSQVQDSMVQDPLLGEDEQDRAMLQNLVKIKDEEIKQLKRQLGVTELENSPSRSNASPLRPSKQGSLSQHDGLRPINLDQSVRLEDQLAAMNQDTLEEQVKSLIKDNYELKMQSAADCEELDALRAELASMQQPHKLGAQQNELRDVKCQVYEVINTCQHMLISQGMDYDQQVDAENNLRLNRELFSLELTSISDLSRFLNWEISHLQTISDLAAQLRRLISVQEFKPMVDVRRQLEQMVSPQQAQQAQTANSLEALADLVRVNFNLQRQEIDSLNEAKAKAKMEYEQRVMLLTRENQTLVAGYKDAQKQTSKHEMRNQADMTRDALQKMEQLVKLNDDLMQSNNALQAQAQQNFQQVQVGESKIQKLQKDLTFYINKANSLEHNLAKQQLQGSPVRQSHEDTKMSKSMRVRKNHEASPFRAQGPMEQLQPVVRNEPRQDRYDELRGSANQVTDQAAAQLQLSDNRGRGSMPIEESSKLNLLIEEYRRENDRCSKRINELQRKLNSTANRRIRNETHLSSSNNKGNKSGASKSPMGHYPHAQEAYGRPAEDYEQSPERGNYGRVRSQERTSLRRNQQQF